MNVETLPPVPDSDLENEDVSIKRVAGETDVNAKRRRLGGKGIERKQDSQKKSRPEEKDDARQRAAKT